MHGSAKFYGSKDNMTNLLVKISNQIIKACRIWIKTVPPELVVVVNEDDKKRKIHPIYDRVPKDILNRIGDCISLNKAY